MTLVPKTGSTVSAGRLLTLASFQLDATHTGLQIGVNIGNVEFAHQMHTRRLLLEGKCLHEAGNLGIAACHFGELVREVTVDLLDEVEHQVAALVIIVLLFVQNL